MATAARLLRLNDGQMLHAFGIAGMHSSGTMEYDQTGGEVKRVIAGIAARGGIQAAILAQLGLTGPPTIIEGKRGFLKCLPIRWSLKKSPEISAASSRS